MIKSSISTAKHLIEMHISLDYQTKACSPTLHRLFSKFSPKLADTLTGLLIDNIVISALTNRTTILHLAVCILLLEKSLIEQCYEFSLTCTYEKVLRLLR